MRTRPIAAGIILAAAAWLWPRPAEAYIDPTAAGAALQSLYVLFFSALMSLALIPRKLMALFARLKAWLSPGRTPPDDTP